MRTYEELFNEGLQKFIDENQSTYDKICREASIHAPIIGLHPERLIDNEIRKAFINHLHIKYGNHVDIYTTVVTLMARDEFERTQILTDHYTEIAESIGITLDDFLKQNNITI